MSKVTENDVRHVAMLARLGVTDARARELARELNTILDHMDALAKVKTDGVAEYSAFDAGQRLRADARENPDRTVPVQPVAPSEREGLLLVPRLATHEDVE